MLADNRNGHFMPQAKTAQFDSTIKMGWPKPTTERVGVCAQSRWIGMRVKIGRPKLTSEIGWPESTSETGRANKREGLGRRLRWASSS